MAALSEPHHPHMVELRHLRAHDLEHLLQEETVAWGTELDWDFHTSAGLVRRFVDLQALSGYALVANGRAVGYSYFVCEDRKGLIGDLYVTREFATAETESRLMASVLDALIRTPLVKRVESQLMMLRHGNRLQLPHWRYLRVHNRVFMEWDSRNMDALAPGEGSRVALIDGWQEFRHEEAAALIAHAYVGHVDSDINDQYRSVAGARKFLSNIVQFPGCGSFFQPASFVALDGRTGRLCGISLTSLVAGDVGHITQICVSRSARGKGVGYELIRRSLLSLTKNRCEKVSLTVTASNVEAIRLYERMGFRKTREFAAYVWDGF